MSISTHRRQTQLLFCFSSACLLHHNETCIKQTPVLSADLTITIAVVFVEKVSGGPVTLQSSCLTCLHCNPSPASPAV